MLSKSLLLLVCSGAAGVYWSASRPSPASVESIPLTGAEAAPSRTLDDKSALALAAPMATPQQGSRVGTRRPAERALAPPRGPRWTTGAERLAVGAEDLARSIEWRASEAELAQLAQWIAARPDVETALASRDPGAVEHFNSAATAWHQDLIALVGVRGAERLAERVELVLIDRESREPVRVGVFGRFLAVPLRAVHD